MDVFDEDGLREFFADAEARVANLTDDAGIMADEFHVLLFAETQFAKPGLDFRRGGEFADADDLAGLNATERTDFKSGTFAGQNLVSWFLLAHCAKNRPVENGFQELIQTDGLERPK